MSTAQRIFITYGTAVLVLGFMLGAVLGMARMKAPAVRSLATAHVETLLQAAVHLGLAFAVGAVGFANGTATTAAWLLAAGSAMQALGATANWVQRVGDQFAERSLGFYANSASTFLAIPGVVVVAYGILTRV